MTSIFTGVKSLTKKADGVPDSHKIKRAIADNLDRHQAKLDMSRQSETMVRKNIADAIIYLSLMNKDLPRLKKKHNERKFDFRIERHRHNENENFSIVFKVGDSGKRDSQRVGYVAEVLPVLRKMFLEQERNGATIPLTPRAMADVERLCQIYGYE